MDLPPYKLNNNNNKKIPELKNLIDKIINGIYFNYNKSIIIINNKINHKSIPIFGSIIECFKGKLNISTPIETSIIFIIYQAIFNKDLNSPLNISYFNDLLNELKDKKCIDNKSLIDINNILVKLNSNDLKNKNIIQNKIQNFIDIINNINTDLCINNNFNSQIILARYFLFISIILSSKIQNDQFKKEFNDIINLGNQIQIKYVPSNIKINDKELNIFNVHKISEISRLETGFCTYNFIGIDYIIKNLLGNVSKISISYSSKQNFGSFSESPSNLKLSCSIFYSQFLDTTQNIIFDKPAITYNSSNDLIIDNLNNIPRNAIIDTNIKNGIFNYNIKGEHVDIDFNNIAAIPNNKGTFSIYLGNDIPTISFNPIYVYKSSIINMIKRSNPYSTSLQYYPFYQSSSTNIDPGIKESSYLSFSFKNINLSFNIIKIIEFNTDPNNNIIITKITLYVIPYLSPFKFINLPNNRNDGNIVITKNTYDIDNFFKNIESSNNNSKFSQNDKILLIKTITYILSHFDKFITIY